MLVEYFTAATAVDDFGTELDHEPLYAIGDLQVSGRCNCHGHADTCSVDAAARTAACECQHNTAGPACDQCLPLYNDKPWTRGVSADEPSECVRLCVCVYVYVLVAATFIVPSTMDHSLFPLPLHTHTHT